MDFEGEVEILRTNSAPSIVLDGEKELLKLEPRLSAPPRGTEPLIELAAKKCSIVVKRIQALLLPGKKARSVWYAEKWMEDWK